MSLRFQIDPRKDYLHVVVSGTFNFLEAKASIRPFFNAARERSLTRILIYCREMEGSATDLNRYELARTIAAEQGGPFRVAIIRRVRESASDSFYENVAFNRGAFLKVTADPEEAFEWLGIKPSDNSAVAA